MPLDPTNFYSDPSKNILAVYIDPLGILFFGIIMFFIMGYVLIKTESWVDAIAIGILITICFSAALPQLLLLLVLICAVFVFAAVIIDVVVLS